MTRPALAAAALFLALGTAAAQPAPPELRGTVVDSASRRLVAGAVVLLLDAADSVLARGLTNERGEYRLPRPDAARRLQLRRIGFRPRALPLGTGGRLDVALLPIPTMIERVQVVDAARCPARRDRDRALGLWEQARAALLAAVVARENVPEKLVRLSFDRALEEDGRVISQRVRVDSAARTAVSFAAVRSGADFVRAGFLVEDKGGGATFLAPDADVLVDEAFALGYCFHLTRGDEGKPHQVGLGFEAPRRRAGRVDIAGVLWVDTLARALRDVEFRYVGLDRQVAAVRPGGRVAFRDLPNGVVLIDRWGLRIAAVGADTSWTPNGLPSVRTWLDPREVGGEVARGTWPGGGTWSAPLGRLELDVVTREGKPVWDAVVALDETDYRGRSDEHGRLAIGELLPGPYAPVVEDTLLARVQTTLPLPRFVAVRDSAVRLRIVLPTAEEFIADRCRADARRGAGRAYGRIVSEINAPPSSSAWVLARVMSGDGRPVHGTRWSIGRRLAGEWRRVAGGVTGADGFFVSCLGLSLGDEVRLSVSRGGGVPIEVELRLDEKLTVVPLPIPTGTAPRAP